ncbi:unnamed protein product, partial [Anisakis simplex]|uniref:CX domain-containing protein n=1 Tax=Anisakis simplex TaxID=6269 RepID=A0A0M3JCM6_ANISI
MLGILWSCTAVNVNYSLQVHSFISVGGANYGIEHCPSEKNLCNLKSSLNCNSKLVKEMRAQQSHFEGQRTLAIYSTGDHTIGRRCCGTECASLRNASEVYVLGRIGHRSILYGTMQKQFEFISNSSSRIHEPTQKALKRRSLQLPANSTSDSELSGTFQNSTEVTTVTITSSAS